VRQDGVTSARERVGTASGEGVRQQSGRGRSSFVRSVSRTNPRPDALGDRPPVSRTEVLSVQALSAGRIRQPAIRRSAYQLRRRSCALASQRPIALASGASNGSPGVTPAKARRDGSRERFHWVENRPQQGLALSETGPRVRQR
jgi:hypothetical protein